MVRTLRRSGLLVLILLVLVSAEPLHFTRRADFHFVDFSCGTDGTCVSSGAYPPIKQLSGMNYLG